jgi:hypothetical protein
VIVINGKKYTGNNISVTCGRVIIDGKDVSLDENDKVINIQVNGNVEKLSVDACEQVTVTGSAGTVSTLSGDVKCGDVSGSVQTMSGDVKCGNIAGSVTTMSGDVK